MSEIYEALKRSEKDGNRSILLTEDSPETLAETSDGARFSGTLPEKRLGIRIQPDQLLVALSDEHGLASEKFRILASRLGNLKRDHRIKTIQITSAVVGEGKSMIAANLAITLSRKPDERVLLIGGDLRRPTLSKMFGAGPEPGIGEWWKKGSGLPDLYRIRDLRLWFLPAGVTDNPAELLQSAQLQQLIRELAAFFDWIIIDSPPMLPLADTNLWSRCADGTLLIVRQGIAPKRALQRGLDTMDNPKIIGIVLNEATEGARVDYYDQYYRTNKADKAE